VSRSVKEWQGKTDDEAIPPRVKLRVYTKAEGRCAICDRKIGGSVRPAYDHIQALINGANNNRESNLQLLCVSPCHQEKTGADQAIKSKTARVKGKHIGATGPRRTIPGRKFDGTPIPAKWMNR
jgi:5-methylcytosine-specific restriction protein A